jgi:hypothetical protein
LPLAAQVANLCSIAPAAGFAFDAIALGVAAVAVCGQ